MNQKLSMKTFQDNLTFLYLLIEKLNDMIRICGHVTDYFTHHYNF